MNSADGSLFIATHTGLYRTAPDEKKAKRVSDRYQDTMGFTIAGPDHFLRSGHPDARDLQTGTPPLLGLIESTDGGKTWKPISLLGKADFHVLRTVDDRVYGYDATNARLMVSSDRGKTWTERSPPGQVVDFLVEPGASGRLILAAGKELYTSEDDGATWEPIGFASGLLSWPTETGLYAVDPTGAVFASADGGRSWTPPGRVSGEPAALVADTELELYVALHDGTVKASVDGGATWTVRSAP
ncbi:MAG TPA: sialidase family protein [Gaiellaceae bacterium]|nr:sialidase family protein [Gaiellaceae bacterium]